MNPVLDLQQSNIVQTCTDSSLVTTCRYSTSFILVHTKKGVTYEHHRQQSLSPDELAASWSAYPPPRFLT